MRRKVNLYIGDALVDTSEQSFILINYTTEDLTNPAVVKNSYTQQISLPGTPKNNAIFGSAFRLDRVIDTAGEGVIGRGFSPAYKTPFVLRDDDGTVLQRGYMKLESISRKGANIAYKVTLYGGLGGLLYDLSYDGNGNKRTLASLDYLGGGDYELNFVINKTNVAAAWATDAGAGDPDSLWKVINFAPAYNGIPDGNFAPQVGIGVPSDYGLADTSSGYGLKNGVSLFKFTNPVDEWAVKDLRSYLQRPLLSVRAMLKALAKSENNGGHSLDLSGLEDAEPLKGLWLTLPMLPSVGTVKKKSGSLSLTPVTVSVPGVIGRFNVTGTVASGSTMDIALHTQIYATISAEDLPHLKRDGAGEQTIIFLQAVAYDTDGIIVGGSPMRAYYTPGDQTSPLNLAGICGYTPLYNSYEAETRADTSFNEDSATYLFADTPNFSITAQNVARIDVVMASYTLDAERITVEQSNLKLYSPGGAFSYTASDVTATMTSGTVSYTTLDTLRSNTDITKAMLLSTSQTPADYLLGICKAFGLMLVYDEALDKTTMMPRQDFYDGSLPAIDLTERVDLSKELAITPFTFTSKWYDLGWGEAGGYFADEYKGIWGVDYGTQRINTGYDFDNSVKDVLESVVYRNAASVLRHSRYWNIITSNAKYQPSPFVDKGNKYTLWNAGGETKDIEISCPPASASVWYYNSSYPGYDVPGAAKLELADAEGKPIAGEDILVYWDGSATYKGFRLTDDSAAMDSVNNGVPCWLIGSDPEEDGDLTIPIFRRYKFTSAEITASLDFGVPRELDIPNVTYDGDCTLYQRFWRTYLADRYDLNTKVLRCRVRLDGLTVNAGLLRRFFFYDGCYWVLNRIINHSRTTWDATECEFVQVQNMNNYTTGQDYGNDD